MPSYSVSNVPCFTPEEVTSDVVVIISVVAWESHGLAKHHFSCSNILLGICYTTRKNTCLNPFTLSFIRYPEIITPKKIKYPPGTIQTQSKSYIHLVQL